jgi:hypothetical protein
LTKYLARIYERDGVIPIDSLHFGNKPNIDQNIVGNLFFGRASVGKKSNRPIWNIRNGYTFNNAKSTLFMQTIMLATH